MTGFRSAHWTGLYLIDTDIASFAIKGRSVAVRSKLRTLNSRICLSAITHAELLYGLKRLPSTHPMNDGVKRFLNGVRVLPWDSSAADWYAEICHQLTTSGQRIGEMDMLIASHALALDATLVTNNVRHYSRIQCPLRIETWVD